MEDSLERARARMQGTSVRAKQRLMMYGGPVELARTRRRMARRRPRGGGHSSSGAALSGSLRDFLDAL